MEKNKRSMGGFIIYLLFIFSFSQSPFSLFPFNSQTINHLFNQKRGTQITTAATCNFTQAEELLHSCIQTSSKITQSQFTP